MKQKKVALLTALLILVVTLVLVQQDNVYFSHRALAADVIAELLSQTDQKLPTQEANLTKLFPFGETGDIVFDKVTAWEVETVQLDNTRHGLLSVFDDDPTYRLKVNVHVAFEDGSEALLSWESWRYGVVIGPWLLSGGDGPPGWIHPA